MGSIIYERDYTQEVKEIRNKTYTKSSADAWDYIVENGIMKRIGELFRELPHIIIPQNKDTFEECEKNSIVSRFFTQERSEVLLVMKALKHISTLNFRSLNSTVKTSN